MKQQNLFLQNGQTEFDFVIDSNGKLIIGKKHQFLANNQDVKAAGTIKIDGQGQLRRISNDSGHYRPTVEEASQFDSLFRNVRIDTSKTWMEMYKFTFNEEGFITKVWVDRRWQVKQ
ncbi:hypothetical protein HOO54_17285 [Bacillus sp. WMMC1349]|uniref:hypothetical protein n=1 Tax=Bacillus sp. WMMC1349 TaxID=2736254 RepID=UPI001558251D|nr:hypothetical protein [Bacillus sp. WMMC1349]NPC93920.1 hypothetical protein [Bacillus sp. WMMC1349]